jgi:hypothetical protein
MRIGSLISHGKMIGRILFVLVLTLRGTLILLVPRTNYQLGIGIACQYAMDSRKVWENKAIDDVGKDTILPTVITLTFASTPTVLTICIILVLVS